MSLDECLKFAPKGEKFTINLSATVDTTSHPIEKTGTWGITNNAGPDISEDEKAIFEKAFKPFILCVNRFLDSDSEPDTSGS